MARMVSLQGISGALLSVGAPLLARHAQAAELALENELIGYESMIEAQQYLIQAAGYEMQAEYAGQRAKYAKRAGTMGMITSLLQGFGTMAGEGMLDFGKGKPVAKLGTPSGSTSVSSRKSTSGAAHRAGK